jgi:hypothetical protein
MEWPRKVRKGLAEGGKSEENGRKDRQEVERWSRKGEKSEEKLKTLETDSMDLDNGVKELAERMDKEGKETEKKIVQLKESDEKLKESLTEERKERKSDDRKLLERIKGIEDIW